METVSQLEAKIRFQVAMREIEALPVSVALASGKAVKCPVCRIIHPGLFYSWVSLREFCSEKCWTRRER